MGCCQLERKTLTLVQKVFTLWTQGKRIPRNITLIQGISAVSIGKLQYENISKIASCIESFEKLWGAWFLWEQMCCIQPREDFSGWQENNMNMPSETVLVKASYFTIFTEDFLRGFPAIIEHRMGFICVMRRNVSCHMKLKETKNQSFAFERLLLHLFSEHSM